MDLDLSKHILITPTDVVVNKNSEVEIWMRNGKHIVLPPGEQLYLDLHKVVGIKSNDANLLFKNHSDKKIDEIKRREDSLQGFYHYLNFNVNDWVI